MTKEIKLLFQLAVDQGWRVEQRSTGHYKLIAPNNNVVFVSKTPSDYRALKNIERDLRANGLVIVKKGRRK